MILKAFLKLLPQESCLQPRSQNETSDDASSPSRCTGMAFKTHAPSPCDFCVWPPDSPPAVTPRASTVRWPPETSTSVGSPTQGTLCSYKALQGQQSCLGSVRLCSLIHCQLGRAGSETVRNHLGSDSPCQLPQSKYCFGNISLILKYTFK